MSLEHCWGKRDTGIIKSILAKKRRSQKEKDIIQSLIGKHVIKKSDIPKVCECVCFILGNKGEYNLPLFKAFGDAKVDLSAGSKLPMEVLQGLRGTYHGNVPKEEILKLTAKTMTQKERKNVQKRAKAAGVKVVFDPMSQPLVELYIYAFEMGMDDDIRSAIKKKARNAALALPFSFGRVGVLVDDSESMRGSEEQKLKPMATALACRDMFALTGQKFYIANASGRTVSITELIRPGGETDLADALVDLLEEEPESIFIISDGYENAPSGRINEVCKI